MPKFRPGDEVVIRKGRALPVAKGVEKLEAASQRYADGDLDGCKGIVVMPVHEREGYDGPHKGEDKITIAPTDYSKDGRPTGLVDVPCAQVRHTGFARRVKDAVGEAVTAGARIVSRPYSQRGRDNYDRIFGRRS